ncbi:transcriptional regulator, TetR family [Marinactinospora thermotolerans DSM 45154]|uniref:Transcriptional regulator, TetR family n=1 Tax=Marinactinospora thermotolerans DSM 45154 TaxID=1122192 RepID=A0A1T4PIJ0_9ACTN|nr:TetR family transcriptional regulator [Marinactinospora thermotolerans]SJZ91282.1 transcriptional regulator, TetR family [Marinactinospora thermotolerans DSM 45154]
MRPSSKTAILDAALRVVDREGGADISYEAVASESGLTKAGVMYHFPTRDALMLAVVEHAALRWERALLEVLDVPFEQAGARERIRAYATVAARPDALSPADFFVYFEALYHPALAEPWKRVFSRWFAFDPQASADERARLTLARLAADGLWVATTTDVLAPEERDRQAVIDLLLRLTEEDSPC